MSAPLQALVASEKHHCACLHTFVVWTKVWHLPIMYVCFHMSLIDVESSQQCPWFSPNREHIIGCGEDGADWSRQRRGVSKLQVG